MPNNENLTEAVHQRATAAAESLNQILAALEHAPGVATLATTFVELGKLNAKLRKLADKLPSQPA